jgi:Flp pilus assembly protein TadG
MSAFPWRLIRDEDGGPLVETTVMIPFLIAFLLGAVDFMNAFQQWSAAAKAAEIGARIAAVSDPVASGLDSLAANAANNTTVTVGAAMLAFTVTCDGGAATCSCTGFCTGVGSYSAAAMNLIVYGRAGNETCVAATSEYFMGMCNALSSIEPKYVQVVYTQTGLGYAGRSYGPIPTITVSLNAGAEKLPFQFFFLPFANIDIPSMSTPITGESLGCDHVGTC